MDVLQGNFLDIAIELRDLDGEAVDARLEAVGARSQHVSVAGQLAEQVLGVAAEAGQLAHGVGQRAVGGRLQLRRQRKVIGDGAARHVHRLHQSLRQRHTPTATHLSHHSLNIIINWKQHL